MALLMKITEWEAHSFADKIKDVRKPAFPAAAYLVCFICEISPQ